MELDRHHRPGPAGGDRARRRRSLRGDPLTRPLLNVDLGERGTRHAVDLALLDHADVANVACGGHAGSADGAAFWAREAAVRGVAVAAHLSYPDRAGFGRRAMDLPDAALAEALAAQRALLPGVEAVKLHGALYHAADSDARLAGFLARWLAGAGFRRVLTPASGALAAAARAAGLTVLAEAFADRAYRLEPATGRGGRAVLVARGEPGAVLGPDAAAAQARALLERGVVSLSGGGEGAVRADTLCVHGDHADAIATAAAVAAVLRAPRAPRVPRGRP